jgi:plasmid stabilization system protein ParE
MMVKIEYSPTALEDLERINDYISSRWGEDIAKKVLMRIISDIRTLGHYPAAGVDLGDITNIPTTYRYLFSQKNYVFYHLVDQNIKIIRVLNEKQDFIRQLFGSNQLSDTDWD